MDCSCSDTIINGYGDCKKKLRNKLICYVNEPSICPDLRESNLLNKMYSAEACNTGNIISEIA